MMKHARNGHALFWMLIAIVAFGLLLIPVVSAATASRSAVLTHQRSLERTLEAHRLAAWAAAHPGSELRLLPGELGEALPAEWAARVAAQLEGAGDALADAAVTLALEPDVQGARGLHRLRLELSVREPDGTVQRFPVARMATGL